MASRAPVGTKKTIAALIGSDIVATFPPRGAGVIKRE